MTSVEEIAYREGVRSLEGQAQDLEHYRAHTALALSAGGITAAFFGVQAHGQGPAFWVAVGAFAIVVIGTVVMHYPRNFGWDFDSHNLVTTHVDTEPQKTPEFMMRELAVHAGHDYACNRKTLNALEKVQVCVLLFLGVEVISLLVNLIVE
jgi:hypothetical protein